MNFLEKSGLLIVLFILSCPEEELEKSIWARLILYLAALAFLFGDIFSMVGVLWVK